MRNNVIKDGSIFSTRYGKVKVLNYVNAQNVFILFLQTGYKTKTRATCLRKGSVKDKLFPTVCGVGFIGEGIYYKTKHIQIYKCWASMMNRCYSDKYHKIKPTYKNCSVCNEWKNFQNFAEWYIENYPTDGKKYELDKDVKFPGNKIYSPEKCKFVTKSENTKEMLRRRHNVKK